MAHETRDTGNTKPPHRRRYVIAGMTLTILLVLAAIWHVSALSAYDASGRPAGLASRVAAAEWAVRLEPWDARFRWRVATLRAMQLLAAGRIDDAFWLLQPYSQTVRGDALYTQTYHEVVALKAPLDARKAHVQHAKELTGGVLPEQDVQH